MFEYEKNVFRLQSVRYFCQSNATVAEPRTFNLCLYLVSTHHVLAHNLTHKCRYLLQECLSLSPSTPLLHDEHLYYALQPCGVAGQCGSYCPNLLSAVLYLQVGVL
jgi:hypothetical protein